MTRLLTTLLLALSLCTTSQADNLISPYDPAIAYVGRTSTANAAYVRFDYPGTQIRATFEGTSLKLKMKPNSGYYMVEIDSTAPYKVQSPEQDSILVVATGLKAGMHSATLTFCTEALLYRPQLHGLLLDDGCRLGARPQLPERKIEFIGNSITCGFGIEGESPKEPFRYATENQYYTYEAIASRRLNAQCWVVARSGAGVYRSYGGKVTGTRDIMPVYYPQTLFAASGEQWDFSRFQPDVVCINLGTNDTSKPGYRTDLLYQAYWSFYQTLRQHYPDARIVLLTGTMLPAGSQRLADCQQALDRVQAEAAQQGDHHVYRFDMTPEDGSLGWGSCYHPSMRRHARMADELTPFLAKIMDWQ